MVDTLEVATTDTDGLSDTSGKGQCQFIDEHGERCQTPFPPDSHPSRKWCDDHKRGGIKDPRTKKSRKGDVPPITVNIKAPTGRPAKLKDDQQRVHQAAMAWLGMVSQVLKVTGDEVCAEATIKAAPEIALQLALLSEFHPIIVKILAPIEASGEALVWLSLAMAVSPLIITVLTHHKVISDEAAGRIGIFTAMGAVVGKAQAPAEDVPAEAA